MYLHSDWLAPTLSAIGERKINVVIKLKIGQIGQGS